MAVQHPLRRGPAAYRARAGGDAPHPQLRRWIGRVAELTRPRAIHWCDGSQAEFDGLGAKLVANGTCVALARQLRPRSYLALSDPADVARVEDRTFICSAHEQDAGSNNNWLDPDEMRRTLQRLFRGCMQGRTMYVIPFCMGPIESAHRMLGVQLTDSPYVAASMRIMTRMGRGALAEIERAGSFVPCLHSVGMPLTPGVRDVPWPCNAANRYIVHFPETREICSFGSGYGGNALLGKKCLALRIASAVARDEGWLAEHMLILKLISPAGAVHYIAGAFPSACGKTNLSMMVPTIPGWRVQCLGDDIAWMRWDAQGRLRAVNPEAGFFGVAPGTGPHTNPSALTMLGHDTLFTNCARTDEGDVWWEGLTEQPPAHLIDWRGQDWTPAGDATAAHANARFTVPIAQCPVVAPEWEDPEGVPIDAILFGGRRAGVVPLVSEARDWEHGVFMGATMASERTAAAAGTVGELRFDPFAMLPFCGYDMGDYLGHWLATGRAAAARLPRIFMVNWFGRDPHTGRYLWPGFGENSRVLAWIAQRCDGEVDAVDSPIGLLPYARDIDTNGLRIDDADLRQLLDVDCEQWRAQLPQLRAHLGSFARRPRELDRQLWELERRLTI